jgi:Concanavalin A-like lectin/glucanases superfamily
MRMNQNALDGKTPFALKQVSAALLSGACAFALMLNASCESGSNSDCKAATHDGGTDVDVGNDVDSGSAAVVGSSGGSAGSGGNGSAVSSGGSDGTIEPGAGDAGFVGAGGGGGTNGGGTAGTAHAPRGTEKGLVGYWPLDEGAGTKSADKSPVAALAMADRSDAVVHSNVGWTDGLFGKGVLTKTGGVSVLPALGVLRKMKDGEQTVAMWIRLASYTPKGYILDRHVAYYSGQQSFNLLSLWLKVNQIFARVSFDVFITTETVPSSLLLNQWHHVALVCEGAVANRKLNVYVDGRQVATGDSLGCPGTIGNGDPNHDFAFGCEFGGSRSNCIDGIIDELRVYDRALTNDELKELATR